MRIILITIIAISLNYTAMGQSESDIFSQKLQYNGQELQLKGTGLRVKIWMDMYKLGLYVVNTNIDAKSIVNSNETAILKLYILSRLITPSKMTEAIIDGFNLSTNNNMGPLESEINNCIKSFKSGVNKYDLFEFRYSKEKGTEIYKNSKKLMSIKGYAFKKALWGIWFGKNPIDKDLKNDIIKK